MDIICQDCTFKNNIIELDIVQYCGACHNIIYKPNDEIVSQITSAIEHQNGIEQNYIKAFNEIPQSFVSATMVHVIAKINNHSVKFLIDTGAQTSILPYDVMVACNLENILDEKYIGTLHGVGTSKIKGRIHYVDIFFTCGVVSGSFTVTDSIIEPIIGIDVMSYLGMIIDFKKRVLLINELVIPFI